MHAIEKDTQNLNALECLFDALVEVETQQIQEGWHHDLSCLYIKVSVLSMLCLRELVFIRGALPVSL